MGQLNGFVKFTPKDIPSLEGKVIFVTGGTAGIGKACVEAFALRGASHIYFTGRNQSSGESLIADIKQKHPKVGMTFVKMDMSSLAAVKEAAKKFTHDRLDILLNNAGIMDVPPAVSQDGFETQFAVNHLAHAMLIRELLPVLLKTANENPGSSDVRIVSITSEGWKMHPKGGIMFDTIRSPQEGWSELAVSRYGQSKFANVIYAAEIARRHPNITSVSVHPGVVETGLISTLPLGRRIFVRVLSRLVVGATMTPEQGCLNHLWASAGAEKKDLVNGGYYTPIGVLDKKLDDTAKDEKLAKKLYEWTEDVLSGY